MGSDGRRPAGPRPRRPGWSARTRAARCWPPPSATASGAAPRAGTAGTALVTGDWVLADGDAVAARLPRRTELVRGAAGRAAARQALAANVDVVLVLVSLAAAPSPARLDRLLAVAWDSGAQPVVVLTKADLPAPRRPSGTRWPRPRWPRRCC